MQEPRVSVLLPCRDAAATLDEALESLVHQTFEQFEIIAVDDGSSDATPEILSKWTARDSRIVTVRTHPRGIVEALRTAAELAKGDVIARMDADDIAVATRFERQIDFLDTHTDLVACGTMVEYIPRKTVRDGAQRYEQWVNSVISLEQMQRDLFVECPIPHPTLVMRRAVFEAVGGYRDAGWPEDYDLMLRFWEAEHRFGKVPEVLLQWRERPDRLSRTHVRYTQEAFVRCKVHFLRRRIAERPVVVWGAGPVGKSFSRALQDNGHEIVAFVDLDPRKIGQTIHGAPVVHPDSIEEYRSAYVLAAVASLEARDEIRGSLRVAGFRDPDDCCAVA